MAYIDCVVDTHPMAKEMQSVSTHIKGTTAAVVGMRAAVIQAEEEAADHVCDNVNRGFYTLIHSQISQKIAKLQSEVDSHLMKLNQLRKQLLSIKGRMERDYGMISQRYIKLFNGLNKSLQQRVYELDKPTIEFSVKEVNTCFNRTKLLTATVPVSQCESLSISQKILASNMKYRGLRVIDSMTKFLADMNTQKQLTDQILLPEQTDVPEQHLVIPVLISESNLDKYGNKRVDIFITQAGLSPKSQERIKNAVNEAALSFEWKEGAINDEVKNEFSKILSASTSSQRVKDMAHSLFVSHSFQTIKMQ
ncbi:hypothetical protein [Barnesiella sp. An55]|uniref:hypothetical protein n=1 Tax=Barnesiella sp. An55 TaxID=1965646 RepID=UPI000B36F9C5|nr:hypothetical protein [Barnesiella sp. An55]OUN73746.1 hypothetical protein B5G10_04095 [Barnesiella sp. An55]HIZ26802.1 hypothetical protein [Candidatus Barnesiella merdipullorum]